MEPGGQSDGGGPKSRPSTGSVLSGATIAQIGDARYLYVANLRKGKIEVYDTISCG